MGRPILYPVVLSANQEQYLKAITSKGSGKARVMTRARILLLSHQGTADLDISQALGISVQMVRSTRKNFAVGGLDEALYDAPHTGRPPKFDGQERAAITALACSESPQGHSQWSVRLLADKAVEMKLVEEIAPSTVFYILKKTKSNRTGKGNGASHS